MKSLPLRRWEAYEYKPNKWALDNVHLREERFIAGTTARQVGKTVTASIEIDEGMSMPADEFGPPMVGVLAPTYEKAELAVNMYITRLTEVFGKETFRMNQNKHDLVIVNPEAGTVNARLHWLSSDDPYSVVGFTFSKLIVDESQAVPDEVWTKIRPTLDVRNASVVAFGTPDITPEQSWFRGMWLRGQDEDANDYHSFTVSCYENPWMNLETIKEAKSTLSARDFAMLYEGQWVDEEGAIFTHIEDAITYNPPLFDKDKRYVMSVDFAIHDDYNVVLVAEQSTRVVVYKDRWHLIDLVNTYDRIENIWEKWNKPFVVADESGMGEPMIYELRARGMRVKGLKVTFANKMNLIGNLASDIEHRRIQFPDWEDLKTELKAFIWHKTPSGRLSAGAAAGYHDDIVSSMLILNDYLRTKRGGMTHGYNYLTGGSAIERTRERLINGFRGR